MPLQSEFFNFFTQQAHFFDIVEMQNYHLVPDQVIHHGDIAVGDAIINNGSCFPAAIHKIGMSLQFGRIIIIFQPVIKSCLFFCKLVIKGDSIINGCPGKIFFIGILCLAVKITC